MHVEKIIVVICAANVFIYRCMTYDICMKHNELHNEPFCITFFMWTLIINTARTTYHPGAGSSVLCKYVSRLARFLLCSNVKNN